MRDRDARIGALVVGVLASVVVGLLISTLGRIGAPRATSRPLASSTPGLEFRNLRAGKSDEAGKAEVLFDLVWTSDNFPGIFRCTWEAVGTNGRLSGSMQMLWLA